MAETEDAPGIQMPLVWDDPDAAEILFVNQILVQRQQDEYVLTFGQQTPPLLMGTTNEERMESAKHIPYVPIRVAVRVGTTRQRLAEFVKLIQTLLDAEPVQE